MTHGIARIAARAFIVPREPVVDIGSTPDVVTIRSAGASQDVDEPAPIPCILEGGEHHTCHGKLTDIRRNGAKSCGKYADAAALQARRVRG